MRYLLVNSEAGVYLGSMMGMGFWSAWDSAGQDAAVSFASPEEARAWIEEWESEMPGHMSFLPVPDEVVKLDGSWVSRLDCINAGAPDWMP